jgi:hypothetical protein
MVMFDGKEQATRADGIIREALQVLNVSPEFKFNKCSYEIRDEFFGAISPCRFSVRAIVVRKEIIYSKHLRTEKESFYNYFVRQMLTYDGGTIHDARVVIDGSGDREFRKALNAYLKRYLGSKLRDVASGSPTAIRCSSSQGHVCRRDCALVP